MNTILLASFMALLVTLDAVCPARLRRSNGNLNGIIDEVLQYNKTVHRSFFVEDVQHLVDAGCEGAFFCKVHQILKHEKWTDHNIVRHLDSYIRTSNITCSEVLKGVKSSDIKKPLPDLLDNLNICCRRVNFKSG